jgi:hypothetical protein
MTSKVGQSREGRLNTGTEFSAVPSGLLDDAFLTQDYGLGYFQTPLRDYCRGPNDVPESNPPITYRSRHSPDWAQEQRHGCIRGNIRGLEFRPCR